jgi:uncharacterized protein (UPF0305 family)
MFKDFVMRKMLERQMKDVPPEQREKIIAAFTNNPDLFKKIADEVQEKKKSGKDERSAAMEVMGKYQEELKKIMQ